MPYKREFLMHRQQRFRNLKPIEPWKGPKPPLRMDVSYICRVHHTTLETYLTKVYNMEGYDIKTASGSRFGMTPEYTVTGLLPPMPNIQQLIDNIRRGRRTRNLGLILNLLCADGFIPAGLYRVDMTEEVSPIKRYAELLYETQDNLHEMCIALRETHKNDVSFIKQANILDRQLFDHHQRMASKVSGCAGITKGGTDV